MEFTTCFRTFVSVTGDTFYRCIIKNQIIDENSVLKLNGEYEEEKSINHVTYVQFENCIMTRIPKGLTQIFPCMKVLYIANSKIDRIVKDDLIEYKNLERFCSEGNEHEFLPGDLFEGFKNIRWISFFGSKLKVVEPNILDGLDNLQVVNFLHTTLLNCSYSIYPTHGADSSLDEIKDQLLKTFFASDPQIIRKYMNKLHFSTPKGLVRDLTTYIQDDSAKDLRIQIDDQEFHVHKLLLTIRCPPMAEIFRNNPEAANLNLVDIPVDIFKIILKFLYTDELPGEDKTNFMKLFVAANRLQIKELQKYAAGRITSQINEANALDIFSMSNKYDQNELRQKSFEEIKKKYPKIEFKDEWAGSPGKVAEIIEGFTKMEEGIRKLEDEFKSLMTKH